MGRKKQLIIPNSSNPFLTELLDSLRKRSKSLKHQMSSLSCERVFREHDENQFEVIEIEITPGFSSSKRFPCSFKVWEDRWIFISLSEWKNNTWDWNWQEEGTIFPFISGRELVSAIELTVSSSFEMNSSNTNLFSELWRPYLIRKPELVK